MVDPMTPDEPDEWTEVDQVLRAANPLDGLRAVVIRYVNSGTSHEEMIQRMEQWREHLASEGREADEDVVLEVMDLLVGFSGPGTAL